jgi:glutathione S-transferase
MTTLHRCITPTNWLCPCGKTARALKRAGIEYETVRVPYRKRDRDEVAEVSGQRRVPVLEIDGEAICDSKRIVEHLEWRATRQATAASKPGTSDSTAGAGRP